MNDWYAINEHGEVMQYNCGKRVHNTDRDPTAFELQLLESLDACNSQIETLMEQNDRLSTEVGKLKEIEAAALDAFYLHGYHKSPCMCVDCRLAMILKENSDGYKEDQATVKAIRERVEQGQADG